MNRLIWWFLLVVACLVMALGQTREARAGSMEELQQLPPHEREYLIKAAYLYNFARFTDWPAGAFGASSEPLRICLLGDNPFGRALDALSGKIIKGRRILVSQVLWAEDAPRCHVLFIAESASGHLPKILELLAGRPVLTIGDVADVVSAGVIIGLEIVEKKVRFRVNLDNVETAGLKLSSRLLDLAVIVRNGAGASGRRNQAEVPSDN